jgi:hypothetical protein
MVLMTRMTLEKKEAGKTISRNQSLLGPASVALSFITYDIVLGLVPAMETVGQ